MDVPGTLFPVTTSHPQPEMPVDICGTPSLHDADRRDALTAYTPRRPEKSVLYRVLIECPDDQVGAVIDSADSRDKAGKQAFQDYLTKLMEKDKDKSIPLVVATHPHSDHIGHLKWVVETYGVGEYVDNGQALGPFNFRGQRPATNKN